MAAQIPEEVLCALSMPRDCTIRRVGGTKNDNFMVKGDEGCLFLRRRHQDYCDPEWVAFDHTALEFLSSTGVAVSPPLRMKGETWIQSEGRLYEAYAWISGNPYAGGAEQDASIAAELARFHLEGRNFKGSYPKGGYARGEVDPDRLLEVIRAQRGISPRTDRLLDFYETQVLKGKQDLPDSLYYGLPQTLVHGDVHPDNMIFRGDKLVKFVDVDWMTRHPRVHDLAYALLFVCGRRGPYTPGGDIWSLTRPSEPEIDRMAAFLQNYGVDEALSGAAERGGLMSQMRLTWAHSRLDGALKVEEGMRAEFLGRDVRGPFEWLDEHCDGDWF